MLRKVYLYGALGKEFGRDHSFDVNSIGEAIEALQANFKRFHNALRHGFYRVVVGERGKGIELSEADLNGFNLGSQPLHIIPVVKGRKRGGIGKLIAGVVLIGLSAATAGMAGFAAPLFGTTATLSGMMGSIGTGLLLTGVASLIAPEAKTDSSENEQSFTMAGPQTTTREGGIVPIVYGEVVTGGTMINGALTIRGKDETFSNAFMATSAKSGG